MKSNETTLPSSKGESMSVFKTLISSLGLTVLAIGLAPSMASAQGIAPVPSVTRTVWAGAEDFTGKATVLGFGFDADGTVGMIDQSNANNNQPAVKGNWSQNGSQVTIRFTNCVYVGQINGNEMTGRAQWTSGPSQGRTWNFSLRLTQGGATPAPTPAPAPAPGYVPPSAPGTGPRPGTGPVPAPVPGYSPAPPVPDFTSVPSPGGSSGR
jgi:hypothetical protein